MQSFIFFSLLLVSAASFGIDCSTYDMVGLQFFASRMHKDVCFPFCHSCRILHLAIIHEDEFIAQQLIQIFPKEVLDIQNNLYQVSATLLFPLHKRTSSFCWNFSIQSDFLLYGISIVETVALFLSLYFQRTVVPLYLQPVLSQGRHCGWFQC